MKDWIQRNFIDPVMMDKPLNVDDLDWAHVAMCTDLREIAHYRVRRAVELKASLLEGGTLPVAGIKVPLVKDDNVLVRRDPRDAYYTLETKGVTYRLTVAQWRNVKENFRPKEGSEDVDGKGPAAKIRGTK